MIILLIDTSTERSVIGLSKDQVLVEALTLPVGLQSSHYLIPMIEEMLKLKGFSPKNLDAVAVGYGPGSYTGLRVGASVAKCLSFALRKPLVGICSLETFIPDEDGDFFSVVDAKISGAYVVQGSRKGQKVQFSSEPSVLPIDQLALSLKEGNPWLVTPSKTRLAERLKVGGIDSDRWIERAPCLSQFQALANDRLDQGIYSDDSSLELLYLRKTQAEIEKQAF